MNKKMLLILATVICASLQLHAMDIANVYRLKFVNKTFADLTIFTAQRSGADPIIVGNESEIFILNPEDKIYFGSPTGVSLIEIKNKKLVREHLTVGLKIVSDSISATDVTVEVDKDGYTKFKKGIEGLMCNENGPEAMDTHE